MYSLGVTAFTHDSAATLIHDGKVKYLIEEERLDRVKHSASFPILSIYEILKRESIDLSDIDAICFFSKPLKQITHNFGHFFQHFPKTLNLLRSRAAGANKRSFLTSLKEKIFIEKAIKDHFPGIKIPPIYYFDHHLCHAASTFYPSSFSEAAILSIDGRGESTTTLMAHGFKNEIHVIKEISVPHSLGHLYAAITKYLGFRPFFDEWKVMGLSAYGNDDLYSYFSHLVNLGSKGTFYLDLRYFEFHYHGQYSWLSEKFYQTFGPPRLPQEEITQDHKNMAYALQKTTEQVGLHLSNYLFQQTGCNNLCMAGGVALNCLMNSRILEESPFEKIFIQPVANDAGTSLGAALLHQKELLKNKTSIMPSIYLGPSYGNEEIQKVLREKDLKYYEPNNLYQEVAKLLSEGVIVAWYQGAMEAGPRALGNRSLLADPRRLEMKDKINKLVKKRESFRPFAPAILENKVNEYFELPKASKSPSMVLTAKVISSKHNIIPAVTHHDGTARVQTVNPLQNKKFYKLISEFYNITDVPVLLNTSFNENEPIVCTPQDAIACFFRTNIEALAIGKYLMLKDHVNNR